jgi:hypothetical protein
LAYLPVSNLQIKFSARGRDLLPKDAHLAFAHVHTLHSRVALVTAGAQSHERRAQAKVAKENQRMPGISFCASAPFRGKSFLNFFVGSVIFV